MTFFFFKSYKFCGNNYKFGGGVDYKFGGYAKKTCDLKVNVAEVCKKIEDTKPKCDFKKVWDVKSSFTSKFSWGCKTPAKKAEDAAEAGNDGIEITAFSAAALGNLCRGAKIDLPADADVRLTITDNDTRLSGDRCDNATDRSGQTATIENATGEIGNGGQVYAERMIKLYGSDKKCYYLVEIEQEGSAAKFYTFKGDVPADGVTLKVSYSCNTRGVKYDDLGAGDMAPADAYTVNLDGTGVACLDNAEFTMAYCVSARAPLETGAELASAPVIKATMMAATAENAADILTTTGINGKTAAENLDLITWIMNQDFTAQDNGDGTGETYTDAEIQGAIWGLTDNEGTALNGGTHANVHELIELALENGSGFEAGAGDIHAVLIVPTADEAPDNTQPFIVGVEQTDCIC